jgi:hypothetical protein
MPAIFISHSSSDVVLAGEIKDWLANLGYENIFLDFDKDTGVDIGEQWEHRLYREIERSQAVILIVTPAWLRSKWCFAEYTQARSRGKVIFPIITSPEGKLQIAPEIQAVRYEQWNEEGRRQLASRIRAITSEVARGFAWDKSRPPYPGMLAFEREDAAVFFDRDDEVREVSRELDSARVTGGERLLLILGASGSGKSSLMKAGVLPLVSRDAASWMVLPTFRPEQSPLTALAKAFAAALGTPTAWRRWRALQCVAIMPPTRSGLG